MHFRITLIPDSLFGKLLFKLDFIVDSRNPGISQKLIKIPGIRPLKYTNERTKLKAA
jgi:hypothetical protein